jgi:hypothetical protein
MGQVGQARRYLLKALRLKPRDADIRANLNFIQETLGEGGGREGLWALIEGIPWWRLSLSFSESLKLTAVLSFCFFILLLLRKRKHKQGRFLSGYPLGFFLMLACAWLLYLYANDHLLNRAVVIHPDAPLLKAPTEQSVSVQGLKEGNLLKVRKTQGDFKLVKTSAGGEGWVKKDQIGEI